MKIAKAMLGGVALAAVPFLANAAESDMSYRYLQAGYVEAEEDFFGETLSGFNVGGSFGFAENFFVFGEFESMEISEGGASLELDTTVVGLGGNYPLSDNIDLTGRIGAAELEFGGVLSGDESGYLVAAGLRGQAGDSVELEFNVVHLDLGDGLDDTGFEAGARYNFNENWAAGLEYQDVGELATFFAGVRYSFAP